MVLNDIIKVARLHITESHGIMFEVRQGVTETFRHMNQYPEGLDCPLKRAIQTVVAF